MIKFLHVAPEYIDQMPALAVDYLQQAIDRTPASTSRLDITLDMAKKGYGGVYLICEEDALVGATYVLSYDTKEGKVISPVLLAGKNMRHWHKDYYDFIMSLAKSVNAVAVRSIGRKGWLRKFPMGKNIGTIYEYMLGGGQLRTV